MHSSGRGEESPEAYRGVVLPLAQQHQQSDPYEGQVQPVGGSPWGSPGVAQQPSGPPLPEPADSTQMLPPYPGGVPGQGPGPSPVPVADATQMLPPYPGGDPGAGGMPGMPGMSQRAAGPGPVSQQVPQHAPEAQSGLQGQPQTGRPHGHAQQPVPPAEATQALPLSIFDEQQSYEQQSYDQPGYEQPGYEQPGYEQQRQGRHQHQPQSYEQPSYEQVYPQQAFPQGQQYSEEYGGGYDQPQAPGPQHDSDYDHLFRNDVPSPPPLRQRIISPTSQPQSQAQTQGRLPGQGGQPGQPTYGQGYEPGYAYDDGDGGRRGGRRMSPKVLIGIVVAGCVVAGLVVGGLLNSGGSASADNVGDKTSAPASTPSSVASGTGSSATGDAAKQQAQALDALLKTSGNSRSSVVSAVESVKNCQDLAGASSDLRSAANQRTGLVSRLGTLAVDKLPGHADLTDALTKAWQASAAADGHYAAWADQAQHNHKVCKGGQARATDEAQTGNRESGTATQQKKRAVRLWNAIAKQYGLTQRQFSQL